MSYFLDFLFGKSFALVHDIERNSLVIYPYSNSLKERQLLRPANLIGSWASCGYWKNNYLLLQIHPSASVARIT